MRKKRHHDKPQFKLSSHAQSRIRKRARTQRMIIIAAAVFLGIIAVTVGVGIYIDRIAPMNAVILRVNDREINMGYYVDALRLYSGDMDAAELSQAADSIASQIVRNEIIRQEAAAQGVFITSAQIREERTAADMPDNRMIRDLIESSLARQELLTRFEAQLPAELEQVRFEIMLVESRSVASSVQAAIANDASLVDLIDDYSANPAIQVLQDWVPYALLANNEVANACRTLDPGGTAVIHDPNAAKERGYWLIEVIDRDNTGAIKPRAILARSLEEAQRAKERLETEDFVTVAEQYSEIHGMFDNAELDWMTPDDMVTEAFNEVVFDLELNEVSDPILETEIQTSGGHWVVRLLERETRAPGVGVAEALAAMAFDEWYQQASQRAVVEQDMTAEQKSWAVQRALR